MSPKNILTKLFIRQVFIEALAQYVTVKLFQLSCLCFVKDHLFADLLPKPEIYIKPQVGLTKSFSFSGTAEVATIYSVRNLILLSKKLKANLFASKKIN